MFKAEVVEQIPDKIKQGKWIGLIENFIVSKNSIVRYRNETAEEASLMYKGLTQARRLNHYSKVIDIKKRRNDVYLKRRG